MADASAETAETLQTPAAVAGGPLKFGGFKDLPGLKVMDPSLMQQPKFQKIIQMQAPDETGEHKQQDKSDL